MKTMWQIFPNSPIRLYIHWTFLPIVLLFATMNILAGFQGNELIWTILLLIFIIISILFHDLAQVLMAILFGIKIKSLVFIPTGGLLAYSGTDKKNRHVAQELIMLAAGPFVNLLIAVLLIFFLHPYQAYWNEPENLGVAYRGNFLFQLQVINMTLGLVNLLPAFPMDAGKALEAIFVGRLPLTKAMRVVSLVSVLTAFVLILTGLINQKFILALIGLFILLTMKTGSPYQHAGKTNHRASEKKLAGGI